MSAVINRPAPIAIGAYRTATVGSAVRAVRPASGATLRPVEGQRRVGAIVTRKNAVIIAVAFVLIMLGRLFISVGIDANAYQIAGLAKSEQYLQRDANFIQEQLDVLDSPQNLSDVAQGLGMIANPRPAYLRISDGRKWGRADVGFGGHIDHTRIANQLISTLGVDSTLTGVATNKNAQSPANSKSSTTASSSVSSTTTSSTTPSSGIPVPNTH
jgi:hypothetical protein